MKHRSNPTKRPPELLNLWWNRYCEGDLHELSASPETPSSPSGVWTIRPDDAASSTTDFIRRALEDGDDRNNGSGGEERPLPEVLGGKWRIERCLGGGTFGWFYAARHTILDMPVGVKVLRRRFTASGEGRSSFHEEAMRLCRLNHPNIVRVFDYGEEDATPYLVMELLQGEPLNELLATERLQIEDTVEILRQVTEALFHAHQGGGSQDPLIHLDLKPEHIFVEKIQDRWYAKVIDFGIAEIVSAPTRPAEAPSRDSANEPPVRVAGTVAYMAPERWVGAVDPRCDIFSLGVILYETIAGQRPFDPEESADSAHFADIGSPPRPTTLSGARRSTHVRDLDRIALRALERDPERRFQSAAELGRVLQGWLHRPRRSLLERCTRLALLPLLLAAPLTVLLYWGPWESLHTSLAGQEVVLGPSSQLPPIEAHLNGMGYESASFRLRSVQEPGTGVARGSIVEIPLAARIVAGSFRIPWPSWTRWSEMDRGDSPDVTEYEARIVLRGLPGREIVSRSWRLKLDARPPRFLRFSGVRSWGDDGVVLVEGAEIVVHADEDLDVDRCLLNEHSGKSIAADMRGVRFPAFDRSPVIRLVLCDRSGNETAHREWNVRWLPAGQPELISPQEFFTNRRRYEIPFLLSQDPGRAVLIDLDGREREIDFGSGGEGWEANVPVTLETGHEAARENDFTLRLWSHEDAVPPRDHALRVVHRACDLRIETRAGRQSTLSELPEFTAVSGGQVPDGVAWEVPFVLIDGQTYTGQVLPRGELEIEGAESASGWAVVVVRARDRYGNRAETAVDFPFRLEAPGIVSTSIDIGSKDFPLPHRDCPGRVRATARRELLVQVAYPEYEFLSVFVAIQGGPQLAMHAKGSARPRMYTMSVDELVPHLEIGINTIELRALDTRRPDRIAARSLILHTAPPLTVHGDPAASGGVDGDRVEACYEVLGPPIREITIAGQPVDTSSPGNRFCAPVDVPAVGTSEVTAEVRLASGYVHSASSELWRALPLDGRRYRFDLDGLPRPLTLRFRRGRPESGLEASWVIEPDELEQLHGTMLDETRVDSPETDSSQRSRARMTHMGLTRSGVDEVLVWLTSNIPDLRRTKLPDRSLWEALTSRRPGRSSSSTGFEFEWLAGSDPRIGTWPELRIRRGRDGDIEVEGAEGDERYRARLVVPFDAEGNLVPRHATALLANEAGP